MATNIEDPQMTAIAFTEMENSLLIDCDNDDGILSSYSLPTFSQLSKCSKQESLLTRSQYAMVVFHGVADTYPTDSDIVCRYSLTNGVEAAPGDRIVLFTVGWSSIKDYIVFEWAPIPEKDERDLTVVFKAADLPKDVNEFYQVCYVNNATAVCGASIPFQVRTPSNDELTFALEEDMVVIRSTTAVAQDKLLKAQLDRQNLNKKKVNLEKELRALEDKHSLTLSHLDRLQETLSSSNDLNEELKKENSHLIGINQQILCTQKQLEEAHIKLDNAEQEKRQMQESMEDFEAMTTALQDRNNHLEIMVKRLEDDLITATKHIATLKKQHEKYINELGITNENLKHSDHSKADLAKTNFALKNELKVCKFNLNNAQLENLRLQAELEDLANDKKKLSEEVKNTKQSAGMHQSFYAKYSVTNKGRLIMNNEKLQRTTEDMQLTISTLDQQKSILKRVLEDTLDAQKNVCTDHCTLEKRVAQLQYRLDEVSNNEKRAIELKQSSSHINQSSSLANQVETLEKLLDDSLKENELHMQENMALRIQNEILEANISEKSAAETFIHVSSADGNSRTIQDTSRAESRPHTSETTAVDSRGSVYELSIEIESLQQRLIAQQELIDDYVHCLTNKDGEIHDLSSKLSALKKEFSEMKKEFNLEIASLVSKKNMLVEQEFQARELRNEMQRITFMNEELLIQNASLMERIHDNKEKLSTTTDTTMVQKTLNSDNNGTTLEIENKYFEEQLRLAREELNTTQKQAESVILQLQEYKDRNDCLDKEVAALKKTNDFVDSRYLALTERCEMILQILSRLDTKASEKYHECCAEPKLKQISQSIEHLLSAVKKLTSCSKIKEDGYSMVSDENELKYRLELAREEYEKLHTVMANYRSKYNYLKSKYLQKAGKNNNLST